MTNNEFKVLRAIATNCFAPTNYASPESFDETAPVWSDSINDAGEPSGIEGKALSGVCGSLAAKGFVNTGEDDIALTQAGFDAMQGHQQQ